jgi:hypothetical protein
MLTIGTVALGVDVGWAAEFWAGALGYVPRDEVEKDLYPDHPDFGVLADPDGNLICVIDPGRG